jgi:hypothetical protein
METTCFVIHEDFRSSNNSPFLYEWFKYFGLDSIDPSNNLLWFKFIGLDSIDPTDTKNIKGYDANNINHLYMLHQAKDLGYLEKRQGRTITSCEFFTISKTNT